MTPARSSPDNSGLAQYDDAGRLLDATGVQIPGVLDDLYGGSAAGRSYGVTWRGGAPQFTLWAPTAQNVTLLVGSAAGTDAAERGRLLVRERQEIWENALYRYEVTVYAPSTGKVETNVVTDPYSLALTTDSTYSVAVDLDDPAGKPALWAKTPAPKLARAVDSTIYELHVRDFSISDTTVPAAHRGTYLAFADEGNGTKHLRQLAQAGLNTVHLLPTFDIASIPETASRRIAGLRPQVVRAGLRAAAGLRHRGRRRRTASTGATTRTTGSRRRVVRDGQGRSGPGRRVPHDGRRAAQVRAAGRARPGLTTTRRRPVRRRRPCSTRWCPATTSG